MDTTSLDRQLSDLVHMVVVGLRSGYSLRQCMEAVVHEAVEPAASACKSWVADLEAGCTYDEAFANLQKAWPSPYLAQIVDTIARHQQTGGNLAFQLKPLSDQIHQAVGSDGTLYPAMRHQAKQLRGPVPDRARED